MLCSLKHALREAGLLLNQPSLDKVMAFTYNHLAVFPEVPATLAELERMSNITPVIFSHDTDAMVSTSLLNSLHAHPFKHIVTVEEAEEYKPAPGVYNFLARKVGKRKGEMGEVWLVSENPVDVVGARAAGMHNWLRERREGQRRWCGT